MKRSSTILLCLGIGAIAMPLPLVTAQSSEGASVQKTERDGSKDYSDSSIVVRMMAFDKSNTGKLTRNQITDSRFLRLFDQADANSDGIVTKGELMALAAKFDAADPRDEDGGPGGPDGRGGPGGPGGRGGNDGPGAPGDRNGPGGPGGPGGPQIDWKSKAAQLDLSKLPPPSDKKDLTFETDIRLLFEASCFQCHGERRARADLRLNTLDAVQEGGKDGKVVVPGHSQESILVIAASQLDDETAMPPKRGPGGGPGNMLASQMLKQAGAGGNLSKEKFIALADAWYDKLDPDKAGKITQEQFVARFAEILPAQSGPGQRRGGRPGGEARGPGGRGAPPGGGPGFNPNSFMALALFKAAAANDSDSLTRPELKAAFTKWFTKWDTDKSGSLNEQKLRNGLNALMPSQNQGPQGQGPGGPGGPGGFDGGPGRPGRPQRGGGPQGQNANGGRPGGGRGGFGPPAKPLTSEQVGLVRAWIDQGAK